jgi:phosphoenolpyruvate phosphomutase
MSRRHNSVASDMRRPFPCADAPVYLAGAHDALSAALAVRSGFSAIWASSFGIATSRLEPDAEALRRSSVVGRLFEIAAGVGVPVIADGGTGFEAEGGLQLTVRAFDKAGATGVCLEDKREPRQNSLVGASHVLLSAQEMVEKLVACVRSRLRDDFLIFARTDALAAGEALDATRDRLIRYSESGIDGAVLHVPAEHLASVRPLLANLELSFPLGAILSAIPPPPFRTVAGLGFAFCILPHIGIRAVVPVLEDAFALALAPDGVLRQSSPSVTVPEIDQLISDLRPAKEAAPAPSMEVFVCPHRDHCLNFRRDGETFCSVCGFTIRADHYHDGVRHLRLCHDCFAKHLHGLEELMATLVSPIQEPEGCFNSPFCYSFGVYMLQVLKSCSRCGKSPMPSHFHDIATGKRICLECIRGLGLIR